MDDPRTQATRIQRETGYVSEGVRSGWVLFAGIVLFMVGTFNVIFGLTAIFEDETLSRVGGTVIVWDLTAWGWIHLLLGVLMILTAAGLFGGQEWARWTAVFFATVNAIAQVGFITAYPLWTLLIVTLDIVVIYQLTARWVPPERV
ncbi:MAG TPA: hypothetical protein VD704_12485 [Gaiellaceae bacterium]|nr:hypothetical protein [Gaiellaceae bacterium]